MNNTKPTEIGGDIRIALAGNPNSGKTTLFNALTGSNQFVGNWPGVTVEKKEGRLKQIENGTVTDLPGIYSLSPYTPEELVARTFLVDSRPDAILNIVDGTNLERNLYLTTQLMELGIPVIIAINMIDVVRKNGDYINISELSKRLSCPIIEISALRGDGIDEAAAAAYNAGLKAREEKAFHGQHRTHIFSGVVEHALAHIEEAALHDMPPERQRWYSIKIFERDKKVKEQLKLSEELSTHIENDIKAAEGELDDDAESIITNERYNYVAVLIDGAYKRKNEGGLTVSDKIDRVLTNRFAALPIFAVIMFAVYFISVSTVGAWASGWMNDGVFGEGWFLFGIGADKYEQACEAYEEPNAIIAAYENGEETAYLYDENGGVVAKLNADADAYNKALAVQEPIQSDYGVWITGIPVLLGNFLDSVNCADWLQSLLLDGMVAGVGAVLGFVPQMLVLFLLLAFLEACGYMARIAFMMDRLFRRFGLSGKSFIPMLIGTGCGVPGIMASRTIENAADRRMTIITTTFIPCGAKLPVIALIAGAMFGGAWWVAPSAYFIGIISIVVSGVMLKKTRPFEGETAPFIMELPAYHMPTISNLLNSMWERGWSFIKKAGTVILLATSIIWFLSSFGFSDGKFGMTAMDESLLAAAGSAIAFIFAPLGWGTWQGAVATLTGLAAKENIVGTFGVLFGGFDGVAENGWQIWARMREIFTPLSGYSFLVFNLLCAPCFAAMGAIKREMNSAKWTAFAILYQCGFAYVVSMIIYQLGSLFIGNGSPVGVTVAIIATGAIVYMTFRKKKAGVHK